MNCYRCHQEAFAVLVWGCLNLHVYDTIICTTCYIRFQQDYQCFICGQPVEGYRKNIGENMMFKILWGPRHEL